MFGDLAGPAADVENIPQSAEVELPAAEKAFAHRGVQRKHAASGQHRSLRAVIDIANFFSILLEAYTTNQIIFQDPIDEFSAGTKRIDFVPCYPSMM
jgi:hypothetical protein